MRYELKTLYRDDTTHVIFKPLDFIARLAALVPKPRVNHTRFHGVFALNSKRRSLVTPGTGPLHNGEADLVRQVADLQEGRVDLPTAVLLNSRGGQPGNTNTVRGTEWRDALGRALARKGEANYRAGLDTVTDKVVETHGLSRMPRDSFRFRTA